MRSPLPSTDLPPMTCGSSMESPVSASSARARRPRSGLPGAYSWTGSFVGSGTLVTASMSIGSREQALESLANRSTIRVETVGLANMKSVGVGLGQLLLALDATMVTLVDAPRGLDLPVASAALIDADDVRLGLAAGAGAADVFLLLGLGEDDALA